MFLYASFRDSETVQVNYQWNGATQNSNIVHSKNVDSTAKTIINSSKKGFSFALGFIVANILACSKLVHFQTDFFKCQFLNNSYLTWSVSVQFCSILTAFWPILNFWYIFRSIWPFFRHSNFKCILLEYICDTFSLLCHECSFLKLF